MISNYCIDFTDVQRAAERIHGTAYQTPVLSSSSMNGIAQTTKSRLNHPNDNDTRVDLNKNIIQRQLFFKVEALQRTGSFKFRGALNAIRSVLENNNVTHSTATDTTDNPQPSSVLHVVTHSSGNHAQAVALAAKLSSNTHQTVTATIVMPESTPIVKKNAVIAFGGIPIMTANTNEAREYEATRIQNEMGSTFIHPSEDPRVIAGQGTVCLELISQMKDIGVVLDAIVIPVGGGGLAAGNTITIRALLGNTVKIILAEPKEMDDAKRSFETKTLLQHHPDNALNSVADGLKTTLGNNTWPIIRDMVDDIITVSEIEILTSTKLIWERLKICIEPSAGVGVAAVLSDTFHEKYPDIHNIGIILCGGNVDVVKVAAIMKEMGI